MGGKYITIKIFYSLLSLLMPILILAGEAVKHLEFTVAEEPYSWGGGNIFVIDVNGDSQLDFVIRGESGVYIYEQDGDLLWFKAINVPLAYDWDTQRYNQGVTYGAGDVDGDSQVEIVALDDNNTLHVFDPITNTTEKSILLTSYLLSEQKCAHVAIVNLRGKGDCDAIVQTNDLTPENGITDSYKYYINRSLIALNMETGDTLWTVEQDNICTGSSGHYEGYWGVTHGPFFAADVDWDGLDEVVGGNMIDDDGTEIDLGYNRNWIYKSSDYIDHLDALGVGDLRPGLPGFEWVVTEEDNNGNTNWNTTLLSINNLIWQKEYNNEEPQNVAIGDFDLTKNYCEIWNRSKSNPQHPWIFDYQGNGFADYDMSVVLPSGFNSAGNNLGLEIIWTIDWDGSGREYIAGKARKATGTERNIGVFDAISGDSIWTSLQLSGNIATHVLYVADVLNDPREELVIYDLNDSKIKVYGNSASEPGGLADKWEDPLYRRLKQNWNYYSPGSYTQPPEPAVVNLTIFLDGSYDLNQNKMVTILTDSIPVCSPYSGAPYTIDPIPAGVIDWISIELRVDSTGSTVFAKSGFLLENGHVADTDGVDNGLNLRVLENDYYVVLQHRSHLSIMSRVSMHLTPGNMTSYDFTDNSDRFYGFGGAKELESGVWGMWGGDMNSDNEVTKDDYTSWFNDAVTGESGYKNTDTNLDGEVTTVDYTIWYNNFRSAAVSRVP